MTCANCGRDLYWLEGKTHRGLCAWCADGLAPARGILLAFVVSSLIWWLLWRFVVRLVF